MPDEEIIEEIVVEGQRPSGGSPSFGLFSPARPNPFGDSLDIEEMKRDRAEDEIERQQQEEDKRQALLPPVVPRVVTEIIEEVVVTAPRVARIPLGAIGGVITMGAALAAELAREVSQQRLDESFRAFEGVQPRPKDSPVRTIEPEVIPEVVVTARRTPVRIPQDFTFISPDDDPFTMIPIRPRFLPPTPTAVPAFTVPTPVIPDVTPAPLEIPLSIPAITRPRITPGPGTRPDTRETFVGDPLPTPMPQPVPAPDVQPMPQPGPSPLTPIGTPTVGFPGLTAFPFPMLQPLPTPRRRPRDCPPCKKAKKKKEKERTKCWKKLVKEGRFKRLDRSFKWTPIDCATGKEL